MESGICDICTFTYDLITRTPKRLQCGHVYCYKCIESMIISSFVAKCPRNCGDDNRDLAEIPQDMATVRFLVNHSLQCDEHNQPATGYNLSRYKPICSECIIPSDVNNDILSTVVSRQLFIEYSMNKKTLSKEIREIVKLNCNSALQVRLELIRMIVQYCNTQTLCVNHPHTEATFIDFYDLQFHCAVCEKTTDMQINITDPTSAIRYYCNILLDYQSDSKVICSTVVRFLQGPSMQFISKPYIGLIQMWKGKLGKVEQIGCQSCGKLYHLGLQMPVKLSCLHLICFTCSKTQTNCNICSRVYDPRANICTPIESLYQVPRCSLCQNTVTLDITGKRCNNLPFHNFCNCIICAHCKMFRCGSCNADDIEKNRCYHKLQRRGVKALLYLNITQDCGQCGRNPGSFWDTVLFKVICSNCATHYEIIPLTDLFRLETYLMRYNQIPEMFRAVPLALFDYYPALPIQLKMKIMTSVAYYTPLDRTYPCGQVHQVRRFSSVYPVTTDDYRIFKIQHEYINLTCFTDCDIKVVGVLLAGRTNLETIRQDIYYSWDGANNVEKNVEVSCKEDIIFLNDIQASRCFSIFVKYPIGEEFFSGKLNQCSTIVHEGIEFRFTDHNDLGYDYFGPILGLLYTKDF